MSARRQARVKVSASFAENNGVPLCLGVGRLAEVWAEPGLRPDEGVQSIPYISSVRRRFSAARTWWLASQGIDSKDGRSVVPAGAAWSCDFLVDHDREREARERLARVGCTFNDLPTLTREARRMHDLAVRQEIRT